MTETQEINEDWCRALAKIELHVHLESAMDEACFIELVRQYGLQNDWSDAAISARLSCAVDVLQPLKKGRLQAFLETWQWKNSFIRTLEDYERIAAAAARAQADDGIIYTEFFFSPMHAKSLKLPLDEVLAALARGLASEPRMRSKLIADLSRDYGERICRGVIQELRLIDNPLLVGIGLGGSEHQFPAKHFKRVFDAAREAGFHCNAHAGEMAGARSIQDALYFLRAERIGHATRALEDPHVVTALAEQDIAIEACPYSNLCTGVLQNMHDYPLRAFIDAGIRVAINTDDPLLFGRRLSAELAAVAGAFHLSRADLLQLRAHALDMAWIDHDERRDLFNACH